MKIIISAAIVSISFLCYGQLRFSGKAFPRQGDSVNISGIHSELPPDSGCRVPAIKVSEGVEVPETIFDSFLSLEEWMVSPFYGEWEEKDLEPEEWMALPFFSLQE